jgi:hypothetical protein
MVERYHKSIGKLHLKITLQPYEQTKVLPHEAKRYADHHGGKTFGEGSNPSLSSNSWMNIMDLRIEYVSNSLTVVFGGSLDVSGRWLK